MGCSEGIKVDKVVVFCHLLFEIVLFLSFFYSLFVCLHCPGHSVCEIYENLFFSPCISALTLLPPLLYHSSVKHAVRFMPFALLGIEQKYREKTLWRTCEEDFQIHCTNNIYTNTHIHTCTHMLSFSVSLFTKVGWIKIQRWTLQHQQWKLQFLQPGLSWLTGDISSPLSPTY